GFCPVCSPLSSTSASNATPSFTFLTSSTKKKNSNESSSTSRRRARPTRNTQPPRKWHSTASNANNASKQLRNARSRYYTNAPSRYSTPRSPLPPKKSPNHRTRTVVDAAVADDVDAVGRRATKPHRRRRRKLRVSKFPTHHSSRAIPRSSVSSM